MTLPSATQPNDLIEKILAKMAKQPYLSPQAFKQWEKNEMERLHAIRGSLGAIVGLPTMGVIVSYGVAKGSVIGAAWIGIGFLTGPVLGGLLGGAIAFIAAAMITMWMLPKIYDSTMVLYKRLTEGNFDYRYNKYLADYKANNEFKKLKLAAKEIVKLEKEGLLHYSKCKTKLLEGLSPIQKKLFTTLYDAYTLREDSRAEEIIESNKHIAAWQLDLGRYHLDQARAHKKWATKEQHAQRKQTTHETRKEAIHKIDVALIINTTTAGSPPFLPFRNLLGWLLPNAGFVVKPQAPQPIRKNIATRIEDHPQHCLVKPERVIKALLECSPEAIAQFAERITEDVQAQMKKTPEQIKSECDSLKTRSKHTQEKTQRLYLKNYIINRIHAWRSTPCKKRQAPQDMSLKDLKSYQNEIKSRRHFERHNFYSSVKTDATCARLACLIKEKRTAQP